MVTMDNLDNCEDEIPKYPFDQNGHLDKWIKEEGELPSFPEEVYNHLPSFLGEVIDNSISPDDRDVILLGTLACLSACFNNVCGVYDERIVFPNLYLFVVADTRCGERTDEPVYLLQHPLPTEYPQRVRNE